MLLLAVFSATCLAQPPAGQGQGQGPPPSGGGGGPECATDGSDAAVKFRIEGDERVLQSSGCPPYDWSGQTTPNAATAQDLTQRVPVQVDLCADGADGGMGAVGFALDGVALYTPYDKDYRDAVTFEGVTTNDCGSHPQMEGELHYHAHPGFGPNENGICGQPCPEPATDENCNHVQDLCDSQLTPPIGSVEICPSVGQWYTTSPREGEFGDAEPGEHSGILGFAFDGIPVYGFLDSDGAAPTDLDECSGHDSDLGFYHYHAQEHYPYLIGCLRGRVPMGDDSSDHPSKQPCDVVTKTEDYSKVLPTWDLTMATLNSGVQPATPTGNTGASPPNTGSTPTDSGTVADGHAGTDSDTDADTDPDTDPGTDPDTDQGTDPDTDQLTGPEGRPGRDEVGAGRPDRDEDAESDSKPSQWHVALAGIAILCFLCLLIGVVACYHCTKLLREAPATSAPDVEDEKTLLQSPSDRVNTLLQSPSDLLSPSQGPVLSPSQGHVMSPAQGPVMSPLQGPVMTPHWGAVVPQPQHWEPLNQGHVMNQQWQPVAYPQQADPYYGQNYDHVEMTQTGQTGWNGQTGWSVDLNGHY